jgi:hypothetical protein
MREFPKTRPYVTGRNQRRYIAGKSSVTEILVLDDDGNRRSQFGRGGWFGVYFWNGNEWELDAVHASLGAARRSAAAIRRRLLQSK